MNKTIVESLKCPICLDYCEDPVNSTCCESIFCKKCIQGMSNCAMCRKKCQFQESTFARRLVNLIETNCECGYKFPRGNLEDHKKRCKKNLVECPIKNCNKQIMRSDCFEHISRHHPDEMMPKVDSVLQVFKGVANQSVNTISINECVNRNGSTARLGSTGKYYCGKKLDGPKCNCCDNYCGLSTGCNCSACMELDIKARNLPRGWLVNKQGFVARKSGRLFYCGRLVLEGVADCDGFCGPNDGPQCKFFI